MSTTVQRLGWVIASALVALAIMFFSASGCGGSAGNETDAAADTRGDRKAPSDAPAEARTRDAGKDSALDAPSDGCGIPAEGGPVVPASALSLVNSVAEGFCSVRLVGLTEDETDTFVIFVGTSSSGSGVYATPLVGGTTFTILPSSFKSDSGVPSEVNGYSGNAPITIVHSTVFVWSDTKTDPKTGIAVGALGAIFTPTAGVVSPLVLTSPAGLAAATPGSTKVAFMADPDGGTTGDLYVANSDLSASKVLLSGVAPSELVDMGFVNDGFLVMAHEGILSSWDTSAWGKHDLLSDILVPKGAFAWSGAATSGADAGPTTDAAGTVVAATSAGELDAIPVSGGAPRKIDTGVSSFYVKPDGSAVLYGTTVGAYKVATLPSGAPSAILDGGFGGFINGPPIALSPDGNWLTYYASAGAIAGEYALYLVYNAASGMVSPPTLLAAHGAILGDAFTADSTYALYATAPTMVGKDHLVGMLEAVPVAGTAGVVDISKKSVSAVRYLTGTRIVYGDNFRVDKTGNTRVDIFTVDVAATPLTPMSIIQGADPSFFTTTNRKHVVFALNSGNATTDGIYAYAP